MEPWTRTGKIWAGAFVLACLLIVLRLCLALIIRDLINRQLAQMSGYSGRIDGIGLSLWRGAYKIEGMDIEKAGGKAPVPFFKAPLMDIGLQWAALLHGRFVASVVVDAGQLNFIDGPSVSRSQSGKGEDWLGVLESLVPIKINRFQLREGEIHFRNPYGSPPVDVKLDQLNLLAENLSSRSEGHGAGLGSVSATAQVMESAHLWFLAHFDPFAPDPTFDYSGAMQGLNLRTLNPFFLHYAGIDVQGGNLDIYSEAAAADGKFKCYVKPVLVGLKVMKPHEKFDPGKLLIKAGVGVLGWIFKNENGQVATKLEYAGEFKDPKSSLWTAFYFLFENAFIKALPQGLEANLKVQDLQGSSGK
jgi:hypothetical protein